MSKVLVLRTSDKDGKAHGGFQWPSSGPVECSDWNSKAECGNGLHGILWPEGDWSDIKNYDEPLWQVVEVEESTLVKIGGKVKFPRGEVIYSGDFAVALNMVAKAWLAQIPKSYANAGDDPLTTDKRDARIGSSGDSALIGSSGYSAQIGSSGYYARIGSSGYYAQIGSSGDSAQIGSSGYSARIGSSGDSARIGSSGDSARIDSTGKNAVIACAGSVTKFRASENGCIAAPWHDGNRIRFAVGYVGENIKADTWYSISEQGEFVECAA
jgi:hypothetical protein